MRSVGSAVMLVEQTSSGYACCSLRGSACRLRAPRRRSRQCSSLLLIFLCRRGRPVGGVPVDPTVISQWVSGCMLLVLCTLPVLQSLTEARCRISQGPTLGLCEIQALSNALPEIAQGCHAQVCLGLPRSLGSQLLSSALHILLQKLLRSISQSILRA